MTTVTFARLQKFCKIRARSGFSSNMQFWSDLKDAGIDPDELPKPDKGKLGYFPIYRWTFPCGTLIELRQVRCLFAQARS